LAAKAQVIRVVSYNVHSCVGSDGRFDPHRIVAVLEDLDGDIVALQEVEDRICDGKTVTEFLAARLSMLAHRGATLQRGDAPYGNLLLSRRPPKTLETLDISVAGPEPRGAIDATFDLGGDRLRLVATHLGLRSNERRRQARLLLDRLRTTEADVLMMAGDINEWRPGAYSLRLLSEFFDTRSRSRTFPTATPFLGLDRIFVSPASAVRRMHAVKTANTRRASDHLPLVCDLDIG
jgi:endonuclease/exonuclease/phosphatase family metal-dependent hydrolase